VIDGKAHGAGEQTDRNHMRDGVKEVGGVSEGSSAGHVIEFKLIHRATSKYYANVLDILRA
jgi:hypothetical protein